MLVAEQRKAPSLGGVAFSDSDPCRRSCYPYSRGGVADERLASCHPLAESPWQELVSEICRDARRDILVSGGSLHVHLLGQARLKRAACQRQRSKQAHSHTPAWAGSPPGGEPQEGRRQGAPRPAYETRYVADDAQRHRPVRRRPPAHRRRGHQPLSNQGATSRPGTAQPRLTPTQPTARAPSQTRPE